MQKIGVRTLIFLLFIVPPPFYFLPFQASLILAKLQWQNYTVAFFFSVSLWKFYTEWVSLVLGFFSPEWGKENSKENMPKMTLSFIHAIVLGVQKCCGWWKGAFKKAQSKEKKKKSSTKEMLSFQTKLEFWLLSTSLSKNRQVFHFNYA